MRIKQTLIAALTGCALMASAVKAQDAPTAPALRAWVVVDTSPSNKEVLDELRAVAKALVLALQPGDRVRVIAAASSRPRLLLTEQVSNEDASRPEIIRAITEIRPAWMRKANLAMAMSVPSSTVDAEGPERSQIDLVAVLTDGRFDDESAAGILRVTDKLKSLGALVIVTGVEGANRTLLVEATRGGVEFHDLAHCDPSEWVQRARKPALPPPPTADTTPSAGKETSIRAVGGEDSKAPAATESPPGACSDPVSASPPASKEAQSHPIIEEIRATDQVEIRLSVSASPKPASSAAGNRPPAEGYMAPAAVLESNIPADFGMPRTDPSEEITPAGTLNSPDTTFWSKLKVGLLAYWPVAACVVPLLFVGLVALEARRSRLETASGTAVPVKQSGSIIAVVDGKERLIGPVNGPVRLHIGSGSGNALRISAPGVEERHAELACNGHLAFRNLSGKPVEVNGAMVPPGKRIRLELPALIRLGKATIRLYVRPTSVLISSVAPTVAEADRKEQGS